MLLGPILASSGRHKKRSSAGTPIARGLLSSLSTMARFWLLAALVSLVAASAAPPSPVLTLPLTKHVNPAKLRNLASADRARLRSLLHRGKGDRRDKSVNATNNGVAYVVQVGVGSPFTSCQSTVRAVKRRVLTRAF